MGELEIEQDQLLDRILDWGLQVLQQPTPQVDAATVTRALDDYERLERMLRAGVAVRARNPDLADPANLVAPARHVVQHLLDHGHFAEPEVTARLRSFLQAHPECKNEGDFVFSADWFTKKCLPRWDGIFAGCKGAPGLSFLEIGSFEGRSAIWLLHNVLTHPSSRLTCIDQFPDAIAVRFNRNLGSAGLRSPVGQAPPGRRAWRWRIARAVDEKLVALGKPARLVALAGTSRDVLRRLQGPFDFVYVDADHRAASVLEDAVLAWPLLRAGGTMLFDDYTNPDTASGIDAFVSAYRTGLDVIAGGAQLEVRKV